MQKLVKRVSQVQRQAARRARQRMEQENIDNRMRNRQALKSAVAEVRKNLLDARTARQEDWELGPIAPKRDLGFNDYGVFKEQVRQDWSNYGLHQPRPEVVQRRCAWAGGVKQLNLAPKDRVIILDGPDKGKIDRIKSIQIETGTVTLENEHKALAAGMFGSAPRPQSMPISIDSIRLVYPLKNPETGVTRDVIINQLKSESANMESPTMTFERFQYGRKWDRIVPSLNVTIPWPDVDVPELVAMPADTLRQEVEERTFHYSLLSPPMPEKVLDELRNKYSKFRTRHEAWYVERKELEEAARQSRHEIALSMQTPLQEFHERQKEIRDSVGEPELTEEMLVKIGEVMAKKKAAALDQAGLSEVSKNTTTQ